MFPDYDWIGPDDVIIDCGAYLGGWSKWASRRYPAEIYALEPNLPPYHYLLTIPGRIHKCPFGLGASTRIASLYRADDGTSFVIQSPDRVSGFIMSVTEFWNMMGLDHVALMKINIEGMEYELIEAMASGPMLMERVKAFMIQFHDMEHMADRYKTAQEILGRTHIRTGGQDVVWEEWMRKL